MILVAMLPILRGLVVFLPWILIPRLDGCCLPLFPSVAPGHCLPSAPLVLLSGLRTRSGGESSVLSGLWSPFRTACARTRARNASTARQHQPLAGGAPARHARTDEGERRKRRGKSPKSPRSESTELVGPRGHNQGTNLSRVHRRRRRRHPHRRRPHRRRVHRRRRRRRRPHRRPHRRRSFRRHPHRRRPHRRRVYRR